MDEFTFRGAKIFDADEIIKFMNANWGSHHPLVNDRQLFEYYFFRGDSLSFGLCFCSDTLAALVGFIYSNAKRDCAFISIWCADKSFSGAGLALMEQMPKLTGADMLCCNNVRDNVLPLYNFLGFTSGRFTHSYILSQPRKFKVATINNYIDLPKSGTGKLFEIFKLCDNDIEKQTTKNIPKKDYNYLKWRYIDYPFWEWEYKIFRLEEKGAGRAIIVLRIANCKEGTALRMVDYIGDISYLPLCGGELFRLLCEYNAEYIDFYSVGVPCDILNRTGFVVRSETDTNIIPNYHNPLLGENIDFNYITSKTDNFVLFKADGDGDRPPINYNRG